MICSRVHAVARTDIMERDEMEGNMDYRMNVKAIVLAAGKGTRMQAGDSDSPKVMRQVCGKPLIWYVLEAVSFIPREDIVLVVGYKKDDILGMFSGYPHVDQTVQLGTGHAVMTAMPALEGFEGHVLVCYGDMPLLKRSTYEALIGAHFDNKNDCTILTGESAVPLPYGRVQRGPDGGFLSVVEERDCTPEQYIIRELNSGVYMFEAGLLREALQELRNENAQGEYYLTDVPAIMCRRGAKTGICKLDLGHEIIGVNDPEQLKQVEDILVTVQG